MTRRRNVTVIVSDECFDKEHATCSGKLDSVQPNPDGGYYYGLCGCDCHDEAAATREGSGRD